MPSTQSVKVGVQVMCLLLLGTFLLCTGCRVGRATLELLDLELKKPGPAEVPVIPIPH